MIYLLVIIFSLLALKDMIKSWLVLVTFSIYSDIFLLIASVPYYFIPVYSVLNLVIGFYAVSYIGINLSQ